MKFVSIFLLIALKTLWSDTIINSINSSDLVEQDIPLKSNQILLMDNRTQKPVGIIEITNEGKLIRLPLPKTNKSEQIHQTTPNQPEKFLNEPVNPLIQKKREWNKKQIPFLIQEETIQSD